MAVATGPDSASKYLRFIRSNGLSTVIAAVTFVSAYNGGSYSTVQRGALAIAVWWGLGLGVAVGLLPIARPSRNALVACAFLLGLAMLSALSIGWSDSAERAFSEFNRVMLYLGVFAAVVMCTRLRDVRQWVNGLAIGIAAIGLLALGSRLLGDLGNSSDVAVLLPGVRTRLSYPVDYWNGLAIFLGLAYPLLLRAAVDAQNAVARALAVGVVPALSAAIYLTSSRGGAGVALFGVAALLLLAGRRIALATAAAIAVAGSVASIAVLLARDQLVDGPLSSSAAAAQGKSALALIACACLATGIVWALAQRLARPQLRLSRSVRIGVAVAVGLCLVTATVIADPAERFKVFKRSPEELTGPSPGDYTRSHLLSGSGSGRWQFWGAAWDQFKSHPVIGDGAGSYEAWWAQHGSFSYFIRDAHSLYVEMLGELGVIGLVLLLGLLAIIALASAERIRKARSRESRDVAAALAAAGVGFCVALSIEWIWELTAVAVVGIAVLALLTVKDAEPDMRGSLAGAIPRPWRVVFVVLAVCVIVGEAIPVAASFEVANSRKAAARGDYGSALADARKARDIQPWAASTQLQLSLAAEQSGQLEPAKQAIDRAIDHDRTDWRLWLTAARIEAKLGETDAAVRSFRRARSLNPRSPLFGAG